MKSNRREFIKTAALGSVALGLPGVSAAGECAGPSAPLQILVLGGTGFLGPHMVREGMRRGHTVTLFNRGRTNSTLFPDLELIKGDRAGELDGLGGRSWDAVIDNSGYMPQHVQASAGLLSGNIGQYLFVSSISAYESFSRPNDETSPLLMLEDENVTEFSWDLYGELKVLCEKRANEEVGEDRLTILRPTFVCGPGDHTDRFTYWPVRVQKGGEMLLPGSPSHPVQVIDVRDLANFTIDSLERKTTGIFNMVTPVASYTFGNLLEDCQAVSGKSVDPIWVTDEFIADKSVGAGGALPIYHAISGEYAHVSSVSGERARAAGLRNRPMRETIRDLLAWWDTLPDDRHASARFAMTAEKEAEFIAAWNAANG